MKVITQDWSAFLRHLKAAALDLHLDEVRYLDCLLDLRVNLITDGQPCWHVFFWSPTHFLRGSTYAYSWGDLVTLITRFYSLHDEGTPGLAGVPDLLRVPTSEPVLSTTNTK